MGQMAMRTLRLSFILVFIFLLSGCVDYSYDVKVKNDLSGELSMIASFDTNYLSENAIEKISKFKDRMKEISLRDKSIVHDVFLKNDKLLRFGYKVDFKDVKDAFFVYRILDFHGGSALLFSSIYSKTEEGTSKLKYIISPVKDFSAKEDNSFYSSFLKGITFSVSIKFPFKIISYNISKGIDSELKDDNTVVMHGDYYFFYKNGDIVVTLEF